MTDLQSRPGHDALAHARIDALQENLAVVVSKLSSAWRDDERQGIAERILTELRKGDERARESLGEGK